MAGGAFAYIEFYLNAQIDRLEESKQQKQADFNQKKAIVDDYAEVLSNYQESRYRIENYNKSLFQSSNPDKVFEYLNQLNEGNSQITFEYVFTDSVINNEYGTIISSINGKGEHEALVNYINKLENSQLINKVDEVSISFDERGESYDEVNFSFNVESFYERVAVLDSMQASREIRINPTISSHNPFYPLIRNRFPENSENLANVEASRIIGLTSNRVFIIDQTGEMRTLREGDRVYLGFLEEIDTQSKTAKFKLDKAGIIEYVTLEVSK
jgi:hypothetical protein